MVHPDPNLYRGNSTRVEARALRTYRYRCMYYTSIGWMSRVGPSDRVYPYVPRLYLISTIILYNRYSRFTHLGRGGEMLHDDIQGRQNRDLCERVAKRSAKTMSNKTSSTRYNSMKRKRHRNITRVYIPIGYTFKIYIYRISYIRRRRTKEKDPACCTYGIVQVRTGP